MSRLLAEEPIQNMLTLWDVAVARVMVKWGVRSHHEASATRGFSLTIDFEVEMA